MHSMALPQVRALSSKPGATHTALTSISICTFKKKPSRTGLV